jgi:hypothetical protein
MRRSGITSRSKCASFSISQMSCSSAGPRGPAVMMLVLSATGAPVALVKTFDEDMVNSRVAICIDGIRAAPEGTKSLTRQYSADFLNQSGGKIKLKNFRFFKNH